MANPSPIGQVLHRKPARGDARDRVKVTGRINDGFCVEPADGFGPPTFVSEAELVQHYAAKLAEVDADALLRRLDDEANEVAARGLFKGRSAAPPEPDPASPEGIFKAHAAAAEEANAD